MTSSVILNSLKDLAGLLLVAFLLYVFYRIRKLGGLSAPEREQLLKTFDSRVRESVEWVKNNPDRANKVGRRVQGVVGLALMFLGYYTGHVYFDLIRHGVRSQGTIVDFKYRSWRSQNTSGTSTWRFAFMPVVEFRVGEKSYRFENWWGSSSAAGKNTQVSIFYNSKNPSIAMIDQGLKNWIPWGPFFSVGLFLVVVSVFGRAPYRNTVVPGPVTPS